MKKLLFLLLFIPLVSFGQEDIDYSSEKSIYNYLESNSSDDIMEGLWDSPNYGVGAVMIKKINDIKYAVIACAPEWGNLLYMNSTRYRIQPQLGDTIAILEKSKGNEKLFITVKPREYVNYTKRSRRGKKTISKTNEIKQTIDYPSLSNPTIISSSINTDFGRRDVKIFTTGGLKYELLDDRYSNREIDYNFEGNYTEKKEYLSFICKLGIFIKKFPEPIFDKVSLNKPKTKTGEWAGNGSGIIISKSGYIVTNYHVIEDSEEIEVEFILNEEVQNFNAEIIQVDKVNDLAIIKIFDINFDGLNNINYNFKTRSSDVGTKIYTFGYPKALNGMGKEIKVTEGIISSKSGVEGDITSYQITAPLQGGNSGGPLFDDKGNLVGINSSKFNSDETENVNYSIKSSYVLNLIDVLPKSIDLPSSTKLQSLTPTEQIKEISKYVVLIKVK